LNTTIIIIIFIVTGQRSNRSWHGLFWCNERENWKSSTWYVYLLFRERSLFCEYHDFVNVYSAMFHKALTIIQPITDQAKLLIIRTW